MSSDEVGDLLMALWRQWKSASPVKKGAVTQEQYWVLKSLDQEGPLRIKDLATKIGCTPGSASVAIKRMERDGLVDRQRREDDERVVTVSLTDLGRRDLRSWREEQLRSVSALFKNLSRKERENLVVLLGRGLAEAGVTLDSENGRRLRR